MVGGVLWALWTVGFNFVDYNGELGTAAYERYEAYNRLLPLALLPVVVGFLGLHAAQRRSYGWLGRAGFVAALLGLALVVAYGGRAWEGEGCSRSARAEANADCDNGVRAVPR